MSVLIGRTTIAGLVSVLFWTVTIQKKLDCNQPVFLKKDRSFLCVLENGTIQIKDHC